MQHWISKRIFWATHIFLLGSIFACEKKADFLYQFPQTTTVEREHKLKEFQGTRDLDILWVIDNSYSMEQFQNDVIQNTDQFIDGLTASSPLHWRAGMISTDESDDPYVGLAAGDLLDYASVNAADRFKSAVRRLGLYGDTVEKTFDPVIKALRNNPQFLRPGAFLAIILVSDAPEQSRMSAQTFMTSLQGITGDLKRVLFYGFVAPRQWCTWTGDTPWDWSGSPFEELLTKVSGSAYKLCDPQFGKNLTTLGNNLSKSVSVPRIYLDQRPIVATLKVLYKGQEIPSGTKGFWTYNFALNAIELSDMSFAPGDNESVKVHYEVDDGIER